MSKRAAIHSIPASCVVYTPRPLADAIVSALGDTRTATWLEPCVGQGVFVEALASIRVPRDRIRALDLDPVRQPADSRARTLRGREFLAWSQSTRERFSRIAANPPFIALNRLPAQMRSAALRVELPGGRTVALGSNCWVAFLCASIRLLEKGGSLGFVLPASWEYSDYAAPLRAWFPRLFGEVQVHRCCRPLFAAVQEGSVVLVARDFVANGKPRPANAKAEHIFHERPNELIDSLQGGAPARAARRFQLGAPLRVPVQDSRAKLTVGDVMQIRLGGVTGDAGYFLLSDDDRRRNDLPSAACRPVISRAHHLSHGVISESDWRALRDSGERVWLFDPTPQQTKQPPIGTYLRKRKSTGGCNRKAFKVRSRSPWYRTPLQRVIHGFMSGMSSWGPWVVFREKPRLAATNTLYVVRFVDAKTRDEQAAWAMWLLTTWAQAKLRRLGRRYADGLLKFEPGDIANLTIQAPSKTNGAFAAYKRAVRLLLRGKKSASRQIADEWFAPLKSIGVQSDSPETRRNASGQ